VARWIVRLIKFLENGEVILTAEDMDKKISPREYAVQLVLTTLFNTQTSNATYTDWGGSFYDANKESRQPTLDETRISFSERVVKAEPMLIGVDAGDGEHVISGLQLGQIVRKPSGELSLQLEIYFENAQPIAFRFPTSPMNR